jgi:hypothetical protein
MEQDQPARGPVWARDRDKAEAEWVDLTRQVRAETVYALTAARRSLMLPGSLAIKEVVPNVEQQ